MFCRKDLADTENSCYSQLVRWHNTSRIKRFFTDDYQDQFSEERIFSDLESYIDPDIKRWHPLCQAQYLESRIFMSGYLLSSQGDRMMMGNSIEGRFPFLDHNVIEFAAQIPPIYKIYGLNEKFALKKAFEGILPDSVVHRVKQPYRAPISQCFAGDNFASSMMDGDLIKKYRYFNPDSIEQLLKKFRSQDWKVGERDDMTMVGIVSMQLLHHHFVDKGVDVAAGHR